MNYRILHTQVDGFVEGSVVAKEDFPAGTAFKRLVRLGAIEETDDEATVVSGNSDIHTLPDQAGRVQMPVGTDDPLAAAKKKGAVNPKDVEFPQRTAAAKGSSK